MYSNQWVLLYGAMERLQTCFLLLLSHKVQMTSVASMWPLILIKGGVSLTLVPKGVVMPWPWTQMVIPSASDST